MKYSILFFLITPLLLFCSTPEKMNEPISTNEITLSEGWARPSKSGMMSAAYFKLNNGTTISDTLLSIESDVSSNTQIHLSFQNEEGLMSMEEQKYVLLSAQSKVEFKQGGLHVMIIQPDQDLIEGDSLSLKLHFSSSIELIAKIPIRSVN